MRYENEKLQGVVTMRRMPNAFLLFILMLTISSVAGCYDSKSNDGGNCADNARRIQANMSRAQVIDIMGSPDTNGSGGGETQMQWVCGSDSVLVDFQPGDRVYLVLINGEIYLQRSSFY